MLKKVKNNFSGLLEFYVTLKIAPGDYQFKFIVDGVWITSNTFPTIKTSDGVENNHLKVPFFSNLTEHKPLILQEKTFLNWRREDGKWTDCGRIHHTLQGHSLSVICEKVYIFGGLANNKFTNALYIFDPKTLEFSVVEEYKGDVPEPRAFHQ